MAKRSTAVRRAGRLAGSAPLSHVVAGSEGPRARMVDVGKKRPGARTATARAFVRFPAGMRDRVWRGDGPKGPIAEVARCAGLLAAKRTAELIPMCHPLALEHVDVSIEPRGEDQLEIRCHARTTARTGVEMEALTGVTLAALTVYDMTKALDKGITIERVELLEKTGGKSGAWRAPRTGSAPTAGKRAHRNGP